MRLATPLWTMALIAVGWMETALPAPAQMTACPRSGAAIDVSLTPVDGAPVVTALVSGALLAPSCDGQATGLAGSYTRALQCQAGLPATCRAALSALQPGVWVHRVQVTDGPPRGQSQARRSLLLDASAGTAHLTWPLYASALTVSSLSDGTGCSGCLREVLALAEQAPKPALVQFAPEVIGTIALSVALPPLAAGQVTLDAIDGEGMTHSRTIDGNGLSNAALRITGSDNRIYGLRVTNVGGNSDAVLVDGIGAHRNLLDSIQVVGRALTVCGGDTLGCVIDGLCHTAQSDPPLGVCGDDGIALRNNAGTLGENVVRECEVIGAFDKGIKVSEGAVGHIERCHLHDNADGGLQVTLGGTATAVANVVEDNDGTNSASGIAANGPQGNTPPAARLGTRGNIVRRNALRGISVRSLSVATLRDDYVCGNGTAGRGIGFGLAALDAAGFSAQVTAEGLALVHNADGGVIIGDTSQADLGGPVSRGNNAFAFNGLPASNLRHLSPTALSATNNQWEHCGGRWWCTERAVLAQDVFVAATAGPVSIAPAQPGRGRDTLRIDAIDPTWAAAGDLVRIYGHGFDAIRGNAGAGCAGIGDANTCQPMRGNCVRFDGAPAEIVAATPTMLVVAAPATCVAPVGVSVHNRHARGIGRAAFCVLP